jgi:hypothetical protein
MCWRPKGSDGSIVNASLMVHVNAIVIPPPPPAKVPVLGTSQMHMQQGWMADFIDAVIAKGRALPWLLGFDVANGILAKSLNGALPKRTQAWHVWGNPTELYSQVPDFDLAGRSHPYSPETSDDIKTDVADFKARPPKDGPRGICTPISQVTVIPHPTMFPAVDASLNKTPNTGIIPRHPLVMWLRHDALLSFGYADGRVDHVGYVPGIARCQDACIDGRNMTVPAARKILYVCDMGDEDAAASGAAGASRAWTACQAQSCRTCRRRIRASTSSPRSRRPASRQRCAATRPARSTSSTATRAARSPWSRSVARRRRSSRSPMRSRWTTRRASSTSPARPARLRIVDIATRTVGPNLMPANYLVAPGIRNADFYTISVDANGTCGPVGRFMCSRVHTNGNTNSWRFEPNGASVLYGNAIFGSGQGWNTCGDAKYVHEILGHYDWIGGKYHIDQAIQFVGGYANCPIGAVVFDPWVDANTPAPVQAVVDYTAVWRGMLNICLGGPVPNFTRPSLTALMTREGWSPFAGCSNDEIAEMAFDAAEAWIQGGYAGSFRRDDIVGVDLYCVMLFHLVNSQRHIREGAACVNALKTWWTGKGRALPPSPAAVVDTVRMGRAQQSTHTFGSPLMDYRLEVRETTPGSYRIGIFACASNDIRYTTQGEYTTAAGIGPVPADAVIVVDQGMPTEQLGTAGLARGWHAFTVRAAGWNTGAVSYLVP